MSRTPKRVVVFDEHEGSRRVTCHVLEAAGYTCVQATTEAEALALIDTIRPDAVVYECHPRSGPRAGFSDRVRDLAQGRKITIVAVSAVGEPTQRMVSESLDGYLVKPFSMRDLKALLG
jgi:two-component system phosphate regulon response regulator PhoB